MHTADFTLGKAIALSLLLHALLLAEGDWLVAPVQSAVAAYAAQLEVTLRPNAAMVWPEPALLPDQSPPPAARTRAHTPSVHVRNAANAQRLALVSNPGTTPAGAAARQTNSRIARDLPYPPEAIARGLEGEVLVRLILDASGDAIAARLEASCGYALLDNAAVRAARTLHALPESMPREALLPVRFRLR